jgi:hypothetical protein
LAEFYVRLPLHFWVFPTSNKIAKNYNHVTFYEAVTLYSLKKKKFKKKKIKIKIKNKKKFIFWNIFKFIS